MRKDDETNAFDVFFLKLPYLLGHYNNAQLPRGIRKVNRAYVAWLHREYHREFKVSSQTICYNSTAKC